MVVFQTKMYLAEEVQNKYLKKKEEPKEGKKRGLDKSTKSQIPEKGVSLISRWFHSLKTATYSLLRSFRQPVILRPMAWFFLAQVTVPNLSTVMFYYQTDRDLELGCILFGDCTCCWMVRPHARNLYIQSLLKNHETTDDSLVGSHWVVFVVPPRYNFSVSSESCLQNFRQDLGHLWICPC
ncbi:hypothetical protein NC652_004314 [Populus alba x Populus x berolinensis]|nr:hypothetical protein NC652_004314 [Populus alba x Populus x berolinensis]